jgi:hypothetical protein
MRPWVLKAVKKFPEEGPLAIAKRLCRIEKFKRQFPVSRHTIEGDVTAIMGLGNSK